MDEDVMENEAIGSTSLNIGKNFANSTTGTDGWYELNFKGKAAGKLHIRGSWLPNDTPGGIRLPTAEE